LIGPIAIRLRDQIKRQDGRTTLFDAPPETLWKSVKLSVADAGKGLCKEAKSSNTRHSPKRLSSTNVAHLFSFFFFFLKKKAYRCFNFHYFAYEQVAQLSIEFLFP
jgi:hypothetical protein